MENPEEILFRAYTEGKQRSRPDIPGYADTLNAADQCYEALFLTRNEREQGLLEDFLNTGVDLAGERERASFLSGLSCGFRLGSLYRK